MITTADVAPVNLAVRFATELAALAALGFWGSQLGGGTRLNVVLAVALPMVMCAIWGAVVAPRARWRLPDPARLLVELGLFAAATCGIAATAGPVLAAGFAVVVLLNVALMFVWSQRQTA